MTRIEYFRIFYEEHESVEAFWKQHRNEPVYIREIDGRVVRFNDMGFPVHCDVCGEYIFDDESWQLLDAEETSLLNRAGELPDNPSGIMHVDSVEHSCESRLVDMRKEMEVEIIEDESFDGAGGAVRGLVSDLAALGDSIPPEEWAKLPVDLSLSMNERIENRDKRIAELEEEVRKLRELVRLVWVFLRRPKTPIPPDL